jgi:pantothenate kinase
VVIVLEKGPYQEAQRQYRFFTQDEVKKISEELEQIKTQINKREIQLKKLIDTASGSYKLEDVLNEEKKSSKETLNS